MGIDFTQTIRDINVIGNSAVSVTDADKIYLNQTNIVSGSRTIIDEILLFSSNINAILIYLECVCKIFLKYQVRFRLDKCDFLKTRVEYVNYDVTKERDCPAQSKLYIINDWILPLIGQLLF